MDLVRQAQRGELSVQELVAAFLVWEFEPSYKTTDLADDWEFRDDSFEVVTHAFIIDLINEEEYGRIFNHVDARGRGDGPAQGQLPASE
jgi:hypothetical protein